MVLVQDKIDQKVTTTFLAWLTPMAERFSKTESLPFMVMTLHLKKTEVRIFKNFVKPNLVIDNLSNQKLISKRNISRIENHIWDLNPIIQRS